MIDPADFKPGDEVTSARLNARDAARRAATPVVAPGSGLSAVGGSDGVTIRAERSPEGWYRVAAAVAGSAGYYQLVRQVEKPGGTFADGPHPTTPKTVASAREANLNASVPVGAIVRAFRGRLGWTFAYGRCP